MTTKTENTSVIKAIETLIEDLNRLYEIQDDNDENVSLFEMKSDELYPFGEWGIDEIASAATAWLDSIKEETGCTRQEEKR